MEQSSSIIPEHPLQQRHGTLQQEEHVSMLSSINSELSILKNTSRHSNKAKYLHQSVSLTAFRTTVFDGLLSNLMHIHAIFKRSMSDCLTEGTVHSTYEEFIAIDAANQYFTPKGIVAPNNVIPLTPEVDLLGSLSKAVGSAYVHTEDNKVYYFERTGRSQEIPCM